MSDFADCNGRLNIQEQVAQIDRAFDEAAKFRSERAKLDAEADKLNRERNKLDAEAAELMRDRVFMPWQVVATMMGAGAAIFGAGAAFWKLSGG